MVEKKRQEYVIKFPSSKERIKRHQEKIESFRKRLDEKRTLVDRMADGINETFGSVSFFVWNFLFFAVWISINLNLIPNVVPFDPYPFGFLTMIVSLEAIFLSVFVLISQNRQARIADLREEIDFQINLIAEKEITKLIQMQAIQMKHQGIKIEGDEELEQMMQNINTAHIQNQLEKEEQKPATILSQLQTISAPNSKTVSNVLKKIGDFLDRPIENVL